MGIAHCTSCYLLAVNIRSVVANSPMKVSKNWLVLRHGDDLLMHNSTVAIICPSKHLHLWNQRIHPPIFGIRVLYPINGFPLASTPFHIEISHLQKLRTSEAPHLYVPRYFDRRSERSDYKENVWRINYLNKYFLTN